MKVTLTENQITKLMSNYKLLNEGPEPTVVTQSIDLGATWPSGKYLITPKIQKEMVVKLKPLVDFLLSNPSSKVKITISAGESRVTNYDREKCQNGDYSENCKLQAQALSKLRGEQVQILLQKQFDFLKKEGKIMSIPEIPTVKTVLGSTSYTPGKDKSEDPKYRKEQFVKLLIDASASYECLVGLKVRIATKGKPHVCDEAIFDIQLNNQSLGVANLNNAVKDISDNSSITENINKRIKAKVNTYNRIFTPKLASFWTDLYTNKIRYMGRKGPDPRLKPEDLNTLVVFGKTLGEHGYPQKTWSEFDDATRNKFVKYMKGLELLRIGGISYSKDTVVDELIVKKMGTLYPEIKDMLGRSITDGTNADMKLLKKLKAIKGRESDGKLGGPRSQTFTIDSERAQSVVKASSVKDELVLTLTPLVGRSGPYSFLYKSGSHSDVPLVTITNGSGEELYNGAPNIKMNRGSMEQTVLLKTDLCGKPIT
jgi:hypothetical protein